MGNRQTRQQRGNEAGQTSVDVSNDKAKPPPPSEAIATDDSAAVREQEVSIDEVHSPGTWEIDSNADDSCATILLPQHSIDLIARRIEDEREAS